MALIVKMARDADEKELGSFESLEISENTLREPSSPEPLATHVHHRWLVQGEEHSFTRFEIVGPLWVVAPDERRLGPYINLSIVNGVLYVDRRIFGFLDVRGPDIYLSDLGEHWKGLRIIFQPNP